MYAITFVKRPERMIGDKYWNSLTISTMNM